MSDELNPEYQTLLALSKYLNKKDAKKLQEMVNNREPLNEINIWVNNVLTKTQISKTWLHEGAQAEMEFEEYAHLLNEEELLFIKKFYYERYGNAVNQIPKEYLLHDTEEMIKESNRISNHRKNDIFDVSERKGLLLELDENRYRQDESEKTWEDAYSCFGFNAACSFILDECLEELKVKNFDKKLALVRFYIKMNRLRLAHNKDQRNPKRKK